MGIEIKPVGVACNLRCSYCYQNEQRERGESTTANDARILKAIERLPGPVAIFGGEPLLISLPRLENLLQSIFAARGGCAIQTNGTLLSQRHIDLFKKYNVAVGVSFDGPRLLNRHRPSNSGGSGQKTGKQTQDAIDLLLENGLLTAVIVTLTNANTTVEARAELIEWIRGLIDRGCRSFRIHLLEVEPGVSRGEIAPDANDLLMTLLELYELECSLGFNVFDLFREIRNLLLGDDSNASCVWRACDPYSTEAVTGVESDGAVTNCGRTLKLGVNYLKTAKPSYARYIALYQTSTDEGGCKDCRFFLACKGYCPGTAIEGDWRNKTEHCDLLFNLFSKFEEKLLKDGLTPISKSLWRRQYENDAIRAWASGLNFSLQSASARSETAKWL